MVQAYDVEQAPSSQRLTLTASRRYWDLRWEEHTPFQIGDVTVRYGAFEEALPFIQSNYEAIFGSPDGRFYPEAPSATKRRFCDDMDAFLLSRDDRSIGVLLGHPTDWSTYYIRSCALLKEERGHHLVTGLIERLCRTLASVGVDRVEAECCPTNQAPLRVLMGLGFAISGSLNTDRWGTMLRLTKYMNPHPASVFERQFCALPTDARSPTTPLKRSTP